MLPTQSPDLNVTENVCIAIILKLHIEINVIKMRAESRVCQCSLQELDVSVNWIYSKSLCIQSMSTTFSNSRKIIILQSTKHLRYSNINSFLYRKVCFLLSIFGACFGKRLIATHCKCSVNNALKITQRLEPCTGQAARGPKNLRLKTGQARQDRH